MAGDSLGDRMKSAYEDRNRIKLVRRTPVILRLDGRAFHTLTRNMEKPFDNNFINNMQKTAEHVFQNIQGAKACYTQSDEISILICDYDTVDTAAWFDYNVQKMVSIGASMASVFMSMRLQKPVEFDARCFNIPREEVMNYFRWRYNDWVRNSVQMLARAHFSHKELNHKGRADMHEMLHAKGVNWADLKPVQKNGTIILKYPRCEKIVLENFNLMDKEWTTRFNTLLQSNDEAYEAEFGKKEK